MFVLYLLGLLFVGLKLTGHIDWNWFLVVLPFIVAVAIQVGVGIIGWLWIMRMDR